MNIDWRNILPVILCMVTAVSAEAQRHCGTVEYINKLEQSDPDFARRRAEIESEIARIADLPQNRQAAEVITIPVVFHIVYRTPEEDISDEQILSQLETLNKDFRRRNADTSQTPAPFKNLAADTEFQFCIAHTDPDGLLTNGITRTRTNVAGFIDDDDVKYRTSGGSTIWDATKYLNIWVCNLNENLIGYSSVPGANPFTSGVVVDYQAFGNTGAAKSPYNKGRTLTHEIGHWFGLKHIWGDSYCGDDLIDDTPRQTEANNGCPVYPHKPKVCDQQNIHGDMFMNYMDYTIDGCMNMFTMGQKTRMRTIYNRWYQSLASSGVCAEGIYKPDTEQKELVVLYPNPTSGEVVLRFAKFQTAGPYRVNIYDQIGRKFHSSSTEFLQEDDLLYIDLLQMPSGIYTAVIEADGLTERRQFVIVH